MSLCETIKYDYLVESLIDNKCKKHDAAQHVKYLIKKLTVLIEILWESL
jgi:hypothetical protein